MRSASSERNSENSGFVSIPLGNGLLYDYDDGNYRTVLYGFTPKGVVRLPANATHFGIVTQGLVEIHASGKVRIAYEGDFFSISGSAKLVSEGLGMINSAVNYNGVNLIGGPIEDKGRLRYIDGCTDSLLVAPVRMGDPCFNHLHFPAGITQTPHTHPSVRTGIVFRGRGECVVEAGNVPLIPNYAFVIKTETLHSFNTDGESMDVIAFHPDSDFGATDEDHPMINRTIVGGVSANKLDDIRTK